MQVTIIWIDENGITHLPAYHAGGYINRCAGPTRTLVSRWTDTDEPEATCFWCITRSYRN